MKYIITIENEEGARQSFEGKDLPESIHRLVTNTDLPGSTFKVSAVQKRFLRKDSPVFEPKNAIAEDELPQFFNALERTGKCLVCPAAVICPILHGHSSEDPSDIGEALGAVVALAMLGSLLSNMAPDDLFD